MTTSESSYSDKLTIITSSEVKLVLHLEDLPYFRRSEVNWSGKLYATYNAQKCPPKSVFELSYFNLNSETRVKILERVDKLLFESARGMSYKLDQLFGDDVVKVTRTRGTPPGTVHIYSKDLISWYDGKNWHKFTW